MLLLASLNKNFHRLSFRILSLIDGETGMFCCVIPSASDDGNLSGGRPNVLINWLPLLLAVGF